MLEFLNEVYHYNQTLSGNSSKASVLSQRLLESSHFYCEIQYKLERPDKALSPAKQVHGCDFVEVKNLDSYSVPEQEADGIFYSLEGNSLALDFAPPQLSQFKLQTAYPF